MKSFFMKDSVLKGLSFVIAVLLWFYIIAVVDPSVDITVKEIPVRFTNQNLIEERGLCALTETKTMVELKIRGSRKRIADIDNKNIYATVDLASITKAGTYTMPIAISIPYEYDEILSKKPYSANVVVDKIVTEERDVKVQTSGSVANGYIAGAAVSEVKKVSLTGAQTMLSRIKYVGVGLNYDNRAADINSKLEPYFIDHDGKQIEKDHAIYTMVSCGVDTIAVTCPIMKLKSVPVEVDLPETFNKDEYKISVQPENITVYAEYEILSELEAVYTEPVNPETFDEDTQVVKLVIPEGISLRDGISEVTVKIKKR